MAKELLIWPSARQTNLYLDYNARNTVVVDSVAEITRHKDEQFIRDGFWKKVIVYMGEEPGFHGSRSRLAGVSLRSRKPTSLNATKAPTGSRAEFAFATVPADTVDDYIANPHNLHNPNQQFVKLELPPITSYLNDEEIPGYIKGLPLSAGNRLRVKETGKNIEELELCLQSVQSAISKHDVDTFKVLSF